MTAKHVLWYSLGGHPCEMTKHHEDNKGSLFYLACPLHSLSLTCVSFRDWRDLIEDRVVQCWSKQTIHGRDGIIVKNITYLIGRSSKWQTDVFLQKRGKNPLWVPTKGVKRPDHKGRRHLVGRLSRLVELHFRWKVYWPRVGVLEPRLVAH